MIYCLSCKKYPLDSKSIPYGSVFPTNSYLVRLISDSLPSPLPTSGADVENLADDVVFAVGSNLFVRNGSNNKVEQYVFIDGSFKLCSFPTGSGSGIGNFIIDEYGAVYFG